MMVEISYTQITKFDWEKSIEDSIKDGLLITTTTIGILVVLKGSKCKA